MLEIAAEVDDPLLLVSGDPNFTTPAHIINAAADKALGGATGYAPGDGFVPLRQAITEKLARVNDVHVDIDEVCVTTGACGGLFTSLMLAVEPGDDVLVPDPGWSNYAAMVHLMGARSVGYPVGADAGWRLDPATVESLVTPSTTAMILNSPGNPTGAVLAPDDLVAVTEMAARRGIAVISDEAYDQLVFDGQPFSVASRVASDQLLTVYAFSKTYAMTGWRIGYCVGPAPFIRELSLHQEPVVSSASTISQHAALAALEGPQNAVGEMVAAYKHRADQAVAVLDAAGVGYLRPGGSFFIMVDIRDSGLDSWAFAIALLEQRGVAVVPGAAFGPGGEGFVRVSLAASPDAIAEGLAQLTAEVSQRRASRTD